MRGSDLLMDSGAQALSPQPSALSLKTIWNDPSTVEVTGEDQRLGWFLHALTRDEWLLKLNFRVEKKRFDAADLAARLALKSIDDIDEIPVYGRSERVRVKNKPAGFQDITISVHWLKEIDTPEFWQFLTEARESYQNRVEQASTDPKDVSPWKVLGRQWHLKSKGFPAEKRPKWKMEVLESLFALLDDLLPAADVVWNERQFVRYRQAGSKQDRIVIVTKRRVGVDMTIVPDSDQTGIGRMAEISTDHETTQTKDGRTAIRLRFVKLAQVGAPELRKFLQRCLSLESES